jgi:hypothetical protein
MRARHTVATAAVLALSSLALAPGVSGARPDATAAKAKLVVGPRYARCSDPHPKTYTTCPDVLTNEGRGKLQIQFMVEKKQCSAVLPETPGVWSYIAGLKVKRGKVSGTRHYDNYAEVDQGNPDAYGITFTITGKFLSSKRLHLVVKGKVDYAGSYFPDCAGVTFTETHDLRAVGF